MPAQRIIGLYVDTTRDYACAKAVEIAALAKRAGFAIAIDKSQIEALGFSGDDVAMHDAALVVTVGGDGTLLLDEGCARDCNNQVLPINVKLHLQLHLLMRKSRETAA